jgi:myo-inositol 2-dehydrogenase / D-chiro-inositol 1-dehydrogenase
MTVNVGVIGVGMIGQDHIRRLTHVLSGARVTAVNDTDFERTQTVADGLADARPYKSGQELIEAPDVDTVVVCSWGPTHEEYVLASIAAGKQVFCEKPLATTQEACERILDAEVAAGRRLGPVLAIFHRCGSRWWGWLDDMNSPTPRGPGSSRCCPRPGNGVGGGGITGR